MGAGPVAGTGPVVVGDPAAGCGTGAGARGVVMAATLPLGPAGGAGHHPVPGAGTLVPGRGKRGHRMAEPGIAIPVVTAVALVTLALRFRDPARRSPTAAIVELLSVSLGAALLVELALAGTSWGEITATSSLYLLFGSTVAFVLAMVRVIAAVLLTRAHQRVPVDAVVSFGSVSAVAAVLSGAMLVSAFGWAVTALVAIVAVLRALAHPWTANEVLQRWTWPLRGRPSTG